MEPTRNALLRRKSAVLALTCAVLLCLPLAVGATTGKNGYEATRQIDTVDTDGATVFEARSFIANGGSRLAVDSGGTVYIAAATVDSSGPAYLHHEVLSFTPSATGGSGLTRLFGLRAFDAFVRALMVVPASTSDGAGNQVLVKDHLLLVVDGWDSIDDVSFREVWQIDPATPGSHSVLYRKRPEPTSYMGSAGGNLSATVDLEGNIFLLQESNQNLVNPGSIRALRFSDSAGAYLEDSTAVTTDNMTTGQVLAGPDGYLYGFERSTPVSDTPATDRILRIDPNGTDTWTVYAAFGRKFGDRHPSAVTLQFDSDGQLFLMAAMTHKGQLLWFVEPVDHGVDVTGGDRIAEAGNLRKHQFAAGPAGELYVIEREQDGGTGEPDLDAIYELVAGSGGGGSGGGGNGKGKPK